MKSGLFEDRISNGLFSKGWALLIPKVMCKVVFNPYIMIGDHGYDGNHINGIIDLTNKGIGVRQSFL